MFQVIATMSCFGLWIPRAVMITDMTSNWCVVLGFFSSYELNLGVTKKKKVRVSILKVDLFIVTITPDWKSAINTSKYMTKQDKKIC